MSLIVIMIKGNSMKKTKQSSWNMVICLQLLYYHIIIISYYTIASYCIINFVISIMVLFLTLTTETLFYF